jgi:translation elongation factor EF-1alpha
MHPAQTAREICCEPFERVPQLGRLTLRDEGKTIAIGKVTKVASMKKVGAASGGSA